MMGYLPDTNICIHYLKGDKRVPTRFGEVDPVNCFISEITELEMLVAGSAPDFFVSNQREVEGLLLLLQGRVLPCRVAFANFAQHKVRLRRLGRMIDSFDLLIGCTALANNQTLVTRNTRHFADLPGLRLENWVDG